MKLNWKAWLAALAVSTSIVAGCGGGGETVANGVGSGGTGAAADTYSAGTVTGFGSIIIDGLTYDDSAARISVEDNPSAAAAGTTASVKLGMHVETVQSSDDSLKTLVVHPELVGRITALQAQGFVAAGQTVIVSSDPAAPTVFEGAAALADLRVGDVVEVHGARDSAGAIVATRVERKDAASVAFVRIVGQISGLDLSGKTFTIGAQTVDFSAATLLPAGVTLAEGLRVAVWSDQAVPASGPLVARVVRARAQQIANGAVVRMGGLVRELDTATRSFKLGTVTVDAAAATFERGTAADLANGRWVRVKGSWQSGTLVAQTVQFVRDQGDATVDLTGLVSDFVSIASFTVRGVAVDASAATFANGTADNLGNGVRVKVRGVVEGGVVKASTVSFETAPGTDRRSFPGTVASYDSATGAFRLAGIPLDMTLTDSTVFYAADKTSVARSEFGVGDRVNVRGRLVSGVLQVDEVKFVPDALVSRLEGRLYELDSAGKAFTLNGVSVVWTDTTAFDEGSAADLANGVRVEVRGSYADGVLTASRIEIERDALPTTAAVRGTVTEFVSVSSFRVFGQKVDASAAVFRDGTASQLADGRVVKVWGTVVDGVLRATTVAFEDDEDR